METTGGIGIILLIIIAGGALVALRYVIRAALRVGNLASTVTNILKKADFELIRQRVLKDAKTFYESAQAGRCLYTDGISDQLKERLPSFLPPDVAGGIQVHKAALAAYDDASHDRVLTFQAAAAFQDAAGTTRQRRLILKYLAAWSTDTQTGVKRANCPNCGAPVPIVGSKVCQYCGSALKVWAGTGWLLTDLRED